MDWMYDGAKSTVNADDYLMGKKIDNNFELYSDQAIKAPKSKIDVVAKKPDKNRVVNLDIETIRKEDPLVAIKTKEEKVRREMFENPIKMKHLQRIILDTMEKKMKKALKKKNKKSHKKKYKKRRPRDDTSSSADDDDDDDYDDDRSCSANKTLERELRRDINKHDKKSRKGSHDDRDESQRPGTSSSSGFYSGSSRRSKNEQLGGKTHRKDSRERSSDELHAKAKDAEDIHCSGNRWRTTSDGKRETDPCYINDRRESRDGARTRRPSSKRQPDRRSTGRHDKEGLARRGRRDEVTKQPTGSPDESRGPAGCSGKEFKRKRSRNQERNPATTPDDNCDQISVRFKGKEKRRYQRSHSRSISSGSSSHGSDSVASEGEADADPMRSSDSDESPGRSNPRRSHIQDKDDDHHGPKKSYTVERPPPAARAGNRSGCVDVASSSSGSESSDAEDIADEPEHPDSDGGSSKRKGALGYGLISFRKQSPDAHERDRERRRQADEALRRRRMEREEEESDRRAHRNKQKLKKLTDKEREDLLEEMRQNAKWRDDQRSATVQRIREVEDKEEAERNVPDNDASGFIAPMLRNAVSTDSVAGRIKRNTYNIQRSKNTMNTNFAKK